MNLDRQPTIDQLSQLIASVDDMQDSHILYVTKTGDVQLAVFDAATAANADYAHEDAIQFVLDTFMQGEGHTGQQAAQDQAWIDELFSSLCENWAD
ncbi:MAG: hypothetical protein EOO39_19455, partial [Cytophagaceae bacterium]